MTYTDWQIDKCVEALRAGRKSAVSISRKEVVADLQRLADAGITLTFPEPRYYAMPVTRGTWWICERGTAGCLVRFQAENSYWNQRQAEELVERLNREES